MKNLSQLYSDLIELKYELYNSLFLTLPFSPLHRHGALLSIFTKYCQKALEREESPLEILKGFLDQHVHVDSKEEKDHVLFLFLQQVERQVVLFDAVENAAFPALTAEQSHETLVMLKKKLRPGSSMRLVLTAHPTQFYPQPLLNIISDLSQAVQDNDAASVRRLLLQLGRTSLRNAQRPSVEEEALMLLEQYGSIFYDCYLDVCMEWVDNPEFRPQLELGFWPGGDRDGHPGVNALCTLKVAHHLRQFILDLHLEHLESVRRRISFKGALEQVNTIRWRLMATKSEGEQAYSSSQELLADLDELLKEVDRSHAGLFREKIQRIQLAVQIFGFYFASLDIRQSSEVIQTTIDALSKSSRTLDAASQDLVDVIKAIPSIQMQNGELGCHRFIISHAEKSQDLLNVLNLMGQLGGQELFSKVDIVPLFESISDLQQAPVIIEELMQNQAFVHYLELRQRHLTIMVGFSDGSKDGGYISCNWEIQVCKEKITALSERYGLTTTFFDGRGGPAARGGGNTQRYYRAVAERIPLHTIQQTVQGQTIHSYYGTPAAARHNVLQLLKSLTVKQLSDERFDEKRILSRLSERALFHYLALRNDPLFLSALEDETPLRYFNSLNIASRPPKRAKGKDLSLENLRAIPFVGSWSLMKLNVPAYYGLGLAVEDLCQQGEEENLMQLANESLFFQTLLGNAAQALRKSYLPLTAYLEKGVNKDLWERIRKETLRSMEWILKLQGQQKLLEDEPIIEKSVAMREHIVRPLLVIQHAALQAIKEEKCGESSELMNKLIIKSIPANINASRNSA